MLTESVFYAPLDGWLRLLCDGWRLPWIVEPMKGAHGRYAIFLTKGDEQ